jgi:regulator of PEP synthase PpsR (kinase-PPPase family)
MTSRGQSSSSFSTLLIPSGAKTPQSSFLAVSNLFDAVVPWVSTVAVNAKLKLYKWNTLNTTGVE